LIKIITVEREYGCGAADIAKELASRLGWALWDHEITREIANRLNCDVRSVEQREERPDPTFYRLMKVFMRGSYEDHYSGGGPVELLDGENLARLFEEVVIDIAGRGACVIVGRGAPWFLRNREDVLHTFLYAPYAEKLRRMLQRGVLQGEAEDLLERVDRDRLAFVKRYYGRVWPQRDLYHLMLNTVVGDQAVIDLVLHEISILNRTGR
jgi:cytidylate kinase